MYEQSPIRITSNINIPSIATPFTLKPMDQQETPKEGKSVILIKKRAEILALKDQSKFEEALQKIGLVVRQYPLDIRSYQIKGELEFKMKMYQEASETYEILIDMTEGAENNILSQETHKKT